MHAAHSGTHRACAYEGWVASGEFREGEHSLACVVQHRPGRHQLDADGCVTMVSDSRVS